MSMFETIVPYIGFLTVGTLITLGIAVAVFPAAIAVGLVVAFGSLSEHRATTWVSRAFLAVFRGLPELLVIFAFYYGSSILVNKINVASGLALPTRSIRRFWCRW